MRVVQSNITNEGIQEIPKLESCKLQHKPNKDDADFAF